MRVVLCMLCIMYVGCRRSIIRSGLFIIMFAEWDNMNVEITTIPTNSLLHSYDFRSVFSLWCWLGEA